MNGGWFNGDGTPADEKLGEDPLKVAAKEMQATTAAFAQQKADLAKSGLGALMGGGAPAPEAIAIAMRNGGQLPESHNPYAGLTRDEKLSLISQLQKSNAAKRAQASQPEEEPGPQDMVDPIEELSKGGSKGPPRPVQSAPPKTQKKAPPPAAAPTADRAMAKGVGDEDDGPPPKVQHDRPEPEGDEDDDTPDKKAPPPPAAKDKDDDDGDEDDAPPAKAEKEKMRKSMNFGLQAFNVAQSEDTIRKSFGLVQKAMSYECDQYAGTPFEKEALDLCIEYKKTVLAIRKEKLDAVGSEKRWQKMDAARNAYYDKLDALEIKCLEHKRKLMDMAKSGVEAEIVDSIEELDALSKSAPTTMPGAVPIQRPGPDKVNAKDSVLSKNDEEPDGDDDEDEDGEELEKAGEGSKGGKVIGHYPNGKPIYASHSNMKEEALKHSESHAHGDYHVEHHGAGVHALYFKEKGKRKPKLEGNFDSEESAKNGIKHHIETGHSKPSSFGSKINPEAKWLKKSDDLSAMDDFIQKSEAQGRNGEENMNGTDILNDFLSKAEGQGGLPASGVPSGLPSSLRPEDGGKVDGVGAPTGAQSPPAKDVPATAGNPSTGGDQDLQSETPSDEDLESQAGGQKLKKGENWVDWDQARDDGEHLRAQLTSQLLNKSLDTVVGLGVKAPKREAPAPAAPKMPNVYFQKGGVVAYTDSEDERIEKAMERAGGHLTFSQGSQANFGAPVQHDTECGGCGALVKSFLSSCTECGHALHGVQLAESQGLRLSKSVAAALIPGEDDEVQIG